MDEHMVHTHNGICSAIKWNEVPIHAMTWGSLEHVMLVKEARHKGPHIL